MCFSEMFNLNVTATKNETAFCLAGPNWSFSLILYVVIIACALLTIGSFMLAFVLQRHIHTLLNTYVMNLTVANFVYAVLQCPPDIVNHL